VKPTLNFFQAIFTHYATGWMESFLSAKNKIKENNKSMGIQRKLGRGNIIIWILRK